MAPRPMAVTLSREHYEYAAEHIAIEGLSDRVMVELKDYRAVSQTFDKNVSIGIAT